MSEVETAEFGVDRDGDDLAGERDIHRRQVAACHQAQAWRRAPNRSRQHGGGRQIGAVVVARNVITVYREATAAAVDHHVLDMQPAGGRVQAAACVADVDQR